MSVCAHLAPVLPTTVHHAEALGQVGCTAGDWCSVWRDCCEIVIVYALERLVEGVARVCFCTCFREPCCRVSCRVWISIPQCTLFSEAAA